MTLLSLFRTGGGGNPPYGESMMLGEDGSLTGWRGVASAVGHFAGQLDDDEVARLRGLVDAVTGLAPPAGPRPPGSPTEQLFLPDDELVDVAVVRPDDAGAWGVLTVAARELLDRLPSFPRAAVRIVPDGDVARLEHIGTEPLVVDLSAAELGIARWRGWYEPAGSRVDPVAGPDRVTAEPGWTYELPLGDGAQAGEDITVHVALTFAAVVNDAVVPVRVAHEPIPGRPAG